MATLLVQRYQVTAVTLGGSSGEVSLVACAEDHSRSDTSDSNQASSLTDSFFAAINPRRPRRPQPWAPSKSGSDRITVIENSTSGTINVVDFLMAGW